MLQVLTGVRHWRAVHRSVQEQYTKLRAEVKSSAAPSTAASALGLEQEMIALRNEKKEIHRRLAKADRNVR